MAATGPRVELLWWDGCPSWPEALEMLKEQMAAVGLDHERLEVREMASDVQAEREGFPGSPTIRINGLDIQAPGSNPVGLSCRVYRLRDGRISPLPDADDLKEALAAETQGPGASHATNDDQEGAR